MAFVKVYTGERTGTSMLEEVRAYLAEQEPKRQRGSATARAGRGLLVAWRRFLAVLASLAQLAKTSRFSSAHLPSLGRGRVAARRPLMVVLASVLVTLLGTTAWAFWTTTGSGAGAAATGTLNAPTGTTASTAAGSGTVTVSWTAPTSGANPTGYTVSRTPTGGGTAVAACGTGTTPVTTLNCSDTSVPSGTYTYIVTSVRGSWTAAGSASSPVTVTSVGPAAKLAITTQPSSSSAGGTAFGTQPVVTVQDANGNTVTTDSSSVTLAITGSTGTPGAVLSCTTGNLRTAVNGVATFTGCAIDKAGTAYKLTATDGTLSSATTNAFNITTGAAAKLAITTQPSSSATAGTAFATQPVVTVQDAGGNTVTSDASSVSLAITPTTGTPGAVLSCTTANSRTAASGVATFTGCKLGKSGSGYTLTATDGTLTSATTNAISITAGAAAKLAITTQPSGGAGGTAFGTQPVVTVQDANGNTVTSDASSVTLAITPATGTAGAALTCSTNPRSAAAGVATFSGCNIDKSGTGYTLTATDGSLTSAVSSPFNVTVGSAARLAITTQPSNSTGGTDFGTQPVVTVQDAGGNTVTTDSSSVTLAITGSTGTAGAALSCTANPKSAASGVATFAGCKIDKPGNGYTLTAIDGALTSATSNSFNITAGAATSFTVAPTTNTVAAGSSFDITLTALDSSGNTATGYTGTKTIAWTDGAGGSLTSPSGIAPTLTTSVAFTNGVSSALKNQQLTLAGAGQTIKASDGTVSGTAPMTVTALAATRIGFDSMKITKSGGTDVTPTYCALGCSVGSVGNGGKMVTRVSLNDAYGNQVKATAAIIVTLSVNTGAPAPSQTSLTIPNGSSFSSGTPGSTTIQEGNGSYTDTLTTSTTTSGLTGSQASFAH